MSTQLYLDNGNVFYTDAHNFRFFLDGGINSIAPHKI